MTKDEIFAVLKRNIMKQLEGEISEADVVMGKSMADLGANSLDMVEIVSNTLRELRVKVPREELAKLKNMEELVGKIAKYKSEAAPK